MAIIQIFLATRLVHIDVPHPLHPLRILSNFQVEYSTFCMKLLNQECNNFENSTQFNESNLSGCAKSSTISLFIEISALLSTLVIIENKKKQSRKLNFFCCNKYSYTHPSQTANLQHPAYFRFPLMLIIRPKFPILVLLILYAKYSYSYFYGFIKDILVKLEPLCKAFEKCPPSALVQIKASKCKLETYS